VCVLPQPGWRPFEKILLTLEQGCSALTRRTIMFVAAILLSMLLITAAAAVAEAIRH